MRLQRYGFLFVTPYLSIVKTLIFNYFLVFTCSSHSYLLSLLLMFVALIFNAHCPFYVVYIAFLYGVYCHLILCRMLTVEALRWL